MKLALPVSAIFAIPALIACSGSANEAPRGSDESAETACEGDAGCFSKEATAPASASDQRRARREARRAAKNDAADSDTASPDDSDRGTGPAIGEKGAMVSVGIPGVAEPVPMALVRGPEEGDFVVAFPQYPTAAASEAIGGNAGDFGSDFCAEVAAKAVHENSWTNWAWHRSSTVRDAAAPITVEATLASFVGERFAQGVAGAVKSVAPEMTRLALLNPLELTGVTLRVEFAPDAITRTLGTDAVEADLQAQWDAASDTVLKDGVVTFSIGAHDALCDLAAGKLTLAFDLEGNSKLGDYTGTTTVTGLTPKPSVFSHDSDVLRALMRHTSALAPIGPWMSPATGSNVMTLAIRR